MSSGGRMRVIRSDEDIKKDIVDELYWDDRVDASNVMVEVEAGKAILSGAVPSYTIRRVAEKTAGGIRGVKSVESRLIVQLPTTLDKITDIEIDANTRSSLGWHPDIDSTNIEVAVEAGVVKLEGSVGRSWEKLEVEEVIAKIGGVVDVDNQLAVVPTRDVWDQALGAAIVTALERSAGIDAESVTVRVADGRVLLSGKVSDGSVRRRAEEVAFRTSGVKEVDNALVVDFEFPDGPAETLEEA
jgi:osmotically-inducible protein OsmY